MSTAKETLQARLLRPYAAQLDALLAVLTHRMTQSLDTLGQQAA